nr:TVP38/TMEM64 family protein [Blastocatellia bacterium]
MKLRTYFETIRERLQELGKLTPIALVTVFLPMAGAAVLLTVAYPLSNWLRANSEIGMPLYLLGVLVLCGLALLPTNVIGIVGGWAFGLYAGFAVLMAGVLGSAVISFLIHSRIMGDKLPDVAGKHPKADAIYKELAKRSWRRTTVIIFLVRASIITPFALTNFIMASARVRLDSFAIGT